MKESEKLIVPYPVVVEGKYDRAAVENVAYAQVIMTEGFGIFKKKEKLALLRALAEKTPLIVLTDSDGAGKLIRSHISSAVTGERLIQLYIPKINGTEKRKAAPSAEGTLGVEGMNPQIIYDLLLPYSGEEKGIVRGGITKADFYEYGLSGAENSTARRNALAAEFALPPDMTANALLAALNLLTDIDGYRKAAENI